MSILILFMGDVGWVYISYQGRFKHETMLHSLLIGWKE